MKTRLEGERRGETMRELSNRQRKAFCRAFLQSMDPSRAAAAIGCEDGYGLLEMAGVQRELERMRQSMARELRREDVLRGLARLAFSSADGLKELLTAEENGGAEAELSAVAEIRRNANGTVEVKLVDRVKALATLYELLGSGESEGAEAFFRALEEAGE